MAKGTPKKAKSPEEVLRKLTEKVIILEGKLSIYVEVIQELCAMGGLQKALTKRGLEVLPHDFKGKKYGSGKTN